LPLPLHSNDEPSGGGEGVDQDRRMESRGACWGLALVVAVSISAKEEEYYGGREYQWAGQGFDLGYGNTGAWWSSLGMVWERLSAMWGQPWW
jgi:hypothetical protein